MIFTIQEVERIAKLSAIDLTEGEKKDFVNQFCEILEYFKVLEQAVLPDDLELDDEQDVRQAVLRKDSVEKSSVTPRQFSNYIENDYFKVPKVIVP